MTSKRCGAKTRSGSTCQNWGMENGRCRLHGGKSIPPGADHHSFKHGMYSKALPQDRLQALHARADDPDLISNRETLALIDWRIEELTEMLAQGGLPDYNQLHGVWTRITTAQAQGDREAAGAAMRELGQLIERGNTVALAWEDIQRSSEIRSKIADRERRRVRDAHLVMTHQELAVAIARIHNHYLSHIEDPDVLRKIESAPFPVAG